MGNKYILFLFVLCCMISFSHCFNEPSGSGIRNVFTFQDIRKNNFTIIDTYERRYILLEDQYEFPRDTSLYSVVYRQTTAEISDQMKFCTNEKFTGIFFRGELIDALPIDSNFVVKSYADAENYNFYDCGWLIFSDHIYIDSYVKLVSQEHHTPFGPLKVVNH